jgi:hypothetical protein
MESNFRRSVDGPVARVQTSARIDENRHESTASPAEMEIRTNAEAQVKADAKDSNGSIEENDGVGLLRNFTRTQF